MIKRYRWHHFKTKNGKEIAVKLTKKKLYGAGKEYGISPTQFTNMLEEQGFACLICGDSSISILSLDHDHQTQGVRGLLCNNCNCGLGSFKDSIIFLARAAAYLSNFENPDFNKDSPFSKFLWKRKIQ